MGLFLDWYILSYASENVQPLRKTLKGEEVVWFVTNCYGKKEVKEV